MQTGQNSMLTDLPRIMLLSGILVTSAVSVSFVFGRLLETGPARLVPGAKSPEELVDALKKLTPPELSAHVATQVSYLESEPLSIDTINNVALLEALGDNAKKSESIVVEAAARSLRDVQSQLSAVNILVRKQELKQAVFHIDGLLRSRPKLAGQLFKVLAQFQQNPEGLSSVASILNKNPPWRWSYLTSMFNGDDSGQVSYQLLSAIKKAGGEISAEELRTYIGSQIAKKNYELAYFTWLDSLDDESLKAVSFLYDGKFERAPRNQYFDWTIGTYANAKIGVVPKPGEAANQVLRLDFQGGRMAFAHVQQYLRLAPGDYEVSGEWRAESFQSPSGLRWQVYCIGGAASSAPSRLLGAASIWDKFSFSVNVPSNNCETQLLQLQSGSTAALDQRFDGQIYFDNIKVTQVSPAPTVNVE